MAKKSESISFKTMPDIRKMLEQIARAEDRSLSYVVNRILTEYFDKMEQTK